MGKPPRGQPVGPHQDPGEPNRRHTLAELDHLADLLAHHMLRDKCPCPACRQAKQRPKKNPAGDG